MNSDQSRLARWLFGIALVLFGALAWAAYQQQNVKLAASYTFVAHTHRVLQQIESIRSLIGEAETGERGFLLTGDRRYLEPYQEAVERLAPEVDILRDLTTDNLSQQRRVAGLKPLVDSRLRQLQRGISERSRSGLPAA